VFGIRGFIMRRGFEFGVGVCRFGVWGLGKFIISVPFFLTSLFVHLLLFVQLNYWCHFYLCHFYQCQSHPKSSISNDDLSVFQVFNFQLTFCEISYHNIQFHIKKIASCYPSSTAIMGLLTKSSHLTSHVNLL